MNAEPTALNERIVGLMFRYNHTVSSLAASINKGRASDKYQTAWSRSLVS